MFPVYFAMTCRLFCLASLDMSQEDELKNTGFRCQGLGGLGVSWGLGFEMFLGFSFFFFFLTVLGSRVSGFYYAGI